jgi:tape measure domain-containing protein
MADDIKRTLLLNFKAETKGIVDLGVLFSKTEEQAKAMLVEQTKLLDESIKSSEKLAKAQAKEAKIIAANEAKDKKELARQELADLKERNRQATAEAKAQAKEAAQLAKEQAKQLVESTKEQVRQAKEQAKAVNDAVKEQNRVAREEAKRSVLEAKEQAKEQVRILKEQAQAAKDAAKTAAQEAKAQLTEENNARKAAAAEQVRLAREQREAEKQAARDRIAQVRQEARELQAAQETYNRSMMGRLSTAPRYTPQTSMISGMSEAGRTTNVSTAVTLPPPPPRVPEDVKNGYDSLFARIGAINIEYRIWNTLINTVNESLRGIPRVGIELDSVKASLESTMGSTAAMNSALKALDVEAERTGINIGTLRDNFKGFQASTSLAGVSLDSTWRMFTNLNTVITGLHLSADKANHTFLAISQMFNKSKVQSEELVKQLGNLLPGAFASFAASMNITTQELSKQMKAGSVFAKDTMENFLQYMATKFTPAFNASIDNLNANTGRMQSSFTRLQEAIYEKTAPAMNSFVKSVTETVKSMTMFVQTGDNLANTLQTVVVAALSLVAGHIAKLILAYAAMETQAKATKVAMMWSNIEAAAVITFFVTLGETISATYNEFEKIKNARKDFYTLYKEGLAVSEKELGLDAGKLKTEAELLKIKVDQNKAVTDLTEKLEAQQNKFKDLPEQIKKDAGKELSLREQKNLEQAQAAMDTLKQQRDLVRNKVAKDLQQQDLDNAKKAHEDKIADEKDFQDKMILLSDKFPKSQKEAIDKALDTFKDQTAKKLKESQATIDKYRELAAKPVGSVKDTTLAQAKKEAEEAGKSIAEAKEAEARITENAIKKYNAREEAERNRASAIKFKGIKEETKVFEEYQRTAANDAKNQIAMLDSDNKAKILSFEEYARRKQEILDKDYNDEKSWYEKEKALAEQSGKKDLIVRADEKLKRLEDDYQSKSKVAGDETTARMNDYETNLASIHQQYQDILGIERDSTEITRTKLELLNRQIEAEIKEGGEVGKTASLRKEELEILIEARNLKAKMAIYDKETATAEKIHTDAISRINQLENVGQMGSLSATMARTKANERLLEIRQKDVDLAKKAMDDSKPEARPAAQASYDLAVQRLQSLKLVANETGAMIEQSLGNAFEGAFNGLITKSMTARQAFASFTNSILADIAKIIAQEMRSQLLGSILKPLAGAAWGGLTSAFGSSAAASTAGTVGGINMNNTSLQNLKLANGGVVSGAGISAHSGTIVSSPTVFPFAKGVGLMGEAGPEAILPLKRNAQGKLGVVTENAGQSKGNLYNITVNVQSKQGENPEQFGQRAAEAMMRSVAKEEISNARRPGNTLNKSRFG